MKKIIAIYKKEMKEIFKDKKAIFMTLFFPIILYPSLIGISALLAIKGQAKIDKTVSYVTLGKSIDVELKKQIEKDKSFKLINVSDFKKDILEKKIDLYLDFDSKTKKIEVYYNSTKDESKNALDKIDKIIIEYKNGKQKLALKEKGLDEKFLEYYEVNEKNLASKEKVANQLLGLILPLIILFPLLGSVMYSALDLTSGEKERKTIETLFILPVRKEDIMIAKLMSVISMGIFSAGINLLGIYGTFLIAKGIHPQIMDFLGKGLDYTMILSSFFMTIPLIFIIAGIGLILGLLSKDYKEAQNYVTPVYLIFMIPIYFLTSPGWKLEGVMTYVPVLNVFLFFKELSLGTANLSEMGMVFFINISVAIIILLTFSKLFNSELILFFDEKGFNFSLKRMKFLERKGLEVSELIIYYFIIMIVLITLGGILQLKLKMFGVFLTQILIILLPVLLLMRLLNLNYKSILPIKKVSIKETFNSISFWLVGLLVVAIVTSIQLKIFPDQLNDLEGLGEFLKGTSLWQQILILSLTPAICEEVLFRGLLFGSLRQKFDTKYAIIISGFLFGLFHLYPGKILSTALLGMIFAYAVARTGSITSSIILHFLNNFFSLVVSSSLIKYQHNYMLMSVVSILGLLVCINGINWFMKGIKKKEPHYFLK